MPDFEFGDVVRAPFPYTDRDTRQFRPALVVTTPFGLGDRLVWVLMITSAENRPWPGDVEIAHSEKAGLPAPSVIRTTKIATVEIDRIEKVGQIDADRRRHVRSALASLFAD